VKNIVGSYNRTQASQLASSMADRMRANVADITAATTGGTSIYKSLGADPTLSDRKKDPNPHCLDVNGCSPAEMAQNDLYQWDTALKDPSNGLAKTGTIVVAPFSLCPQTNPPPLQITITVSWSEGRNDDKNDDNHDGVIDSSDVDADLIFQTIFQIPRYTC
jgi:type IV pilus assembly protein PilV